MDIVVNSRDFTNSGTKVICQSKNTMYKFSTMLVNHGLAERSIDVIAKADSNLEKMKLSEMLALRQQSRAATHGSRWPSNLRLSVAHRPRQTPLYNLELRLFFCSSFPFFFILTLLGVSSLKNEEPQCVTACIAHRGVVRTSLSFGAMRGVIFDL